MTFRVLRYLRGRFTKNAGRAATAATAGQQKFALPLLAFPLMWLVVFVILVTVASVQGSRDPVTRTVEVRAIEVYGERNMGEGGTGHWCSPEMWPVPLLDRREGVWSLSPIAFGVWSSSPIPFGGTF